MKHIHARQLLETMAPDTPNPRALARRLLEREPSVSSGPDVPAAFAACQRLHRELSRWFGSPGCHALFVRAVRATQSEHPALTHVEVRLNAESRLNGIAEAVGAAGPEAVAAALEALMVAVIELLGRFVGDDMVSHMLELNTPEPDANGPGAERTGEAVP